MKTVLLTTALVLSLSAIPAAAAAGIGLSPSRLELHMAAGSSQTETFTIVSGADTREQVAVRTLDWSLTPGGKVLFLQAGQASHSASPWISLQSDSVEVPAGGQVPYRVSVSVPPDANLNGTYRTMVMFQVKVPSPSNASGIGVQTTTAVGGIIYVTITGTEKNGSKLTDMYADGATGHVIVSNVGNTMMRYSGTVDVRDSSGNTVKRVPIGDGAILRESERDIAVKMPDLPKGYYVLLLLLKDSRGGLLTGQLPYEVK